MCSEEIYPISLSRMTRCGMRGFNEQSKADRSQLGIVIKD